MRLLVWLLLLVNVAILGYFRLVPQPPSAPGAGHEPLQPGKIRPLTAAELAAMPRRTPPPLAESVAPQATAASCYEWGSFAPDTLASAQAVLARLSVDGSVRQHVPAEATRYWVYIPSRKTPELAQAKADELRALGVADFFVVQEPRWRYAISLGVFKDERLADGLLQDLRARGVRSAVKGVRNHEGMQASLLLKPLTPEVVAKIEQRKPDFPGTELKPVNCE